MPNDLIPEVTDASFQSEVLESRLPVLLTFTAPRCGPCRAIYPTLESISASEAGRLKVLQLNVDESQEVAQRYRVMSMPTVLLFLEGQVAGQVVGAYRDPILRLVPHRESAPGPSVHAVQ